MWCKSSTWGGREALGAAEQHSGQQSSTRGSRAALCRWFNKCNERGQERHESLCPPVCQQLWHTELHESLGPPVCPQLWQTVQHESLGPSVCPHLWQTERHESLGPLVCPQLCQLGGTKALEEKWEENKGEIRKKRGGTGEGKMEKDIKPEKGVKMGKKKRGKIKNESKQKNIQCFFSRTLDNKIFQTSNKN